MATYGMQIETPIGESASLLPPHVCSIDGTGETILLLRIKIELYIFLPSPSGNGGACFCFEQPPRLANEVLRDAGPLTSIVSLTHYCSQKAAPGCSHPSLPARRLAEPRRARRTRPSRRQDPRGSSLRTADSPGRRAGATASALPQTAEQSPVRGLPQRTEIVF